MILFNDKQHPALRLDEKTNVQEPFLDQLEALGWTVIRLEQKQEPGASFRQHFGQVVLLPKLEEALRQINPFLSDDQVAEVVRRITTFPQQDRIKNNRRVLELLLENTSVAVNHQTGEPSPTVRYVDWKNLANNSFIAISQFKMRVPGTDHHIVPDIVLFLNGLPIAVIECKSAKVKEPIAEAIDQLLRYSQQRGEGPEGNQELFYYNQFLVATCRVQAKFGTLTTHIEKHWYRWTDPYPLTLDDLPHQGTTVVRAPLGMSEGKIRAAVEAKRLWLYTKVNHKLKYPPRAARKEFVTGETRLYLGRNYRLEITRRDELPGVRFHSGFQISRRNQPGAARLLREWYVQRAQEKLPPKVKAFAESLGVTYSRILISDLKVRWGSCTPKNNLNFNWRIMKAPVFVIDYLIVHELAHLIEPNHTPRFWNIVSVQSPRCEEAKTWLRDNGGVLEEDF